MSRRLVSAALLACLALPLLAAAQPGRGAVAAGNRLYEEGRYEEAHEQYLEALRQAPDSPIVSFNDGNTLYRTEELQRAMESYRQAVASGDPAVEAPAWYNLGNALYKQQQLEPALEAYKEALRRNPADTDAKHNFEVTLEQLQQQQQQSDDRGDENNENQDQQDEQEQPPDQDQQDQQQEQEQGQRDQQTDPEQDQQDRPQDQQQNGEQQQPGALSREEAERLLQAIDEDPSQIRRQRQTTTPARPPRRPW